MSLAPYATYDQHQAAIRPGVPLSDTVRVLRDLATEARNAVTGGGPSIEAIRDRYLAWVEMAELQLRSRFSSDAWRVLLTDRYWHIQTIDGSSARPFPVINNEANEQAARLEQLADGLDSLQRQFQRSPDCALAVPDTNVLLHYRRFDDVAWPTLLQAPTVRLVIPMLVVDELDDLSFRSSPVSDRARSVLRRIRQYLGNRPPHEPSDIRRGATMQILVDPPLHNRLPNNDSELLGRVEHLTTVAGQEVTLITADLGMQLRAGLRGLPWMTMPDDLRLTNRSQSETTDE